MQCNFFSSFRLYPQINHPVLAECFKNLKFVENFKDSLPIVQIMLVFLVDLGTASSFKLQSCSRCVPGRAMFPEVINSFFQNIMNRISYCPKQSETVNQKDYAIPTTLQYLCKTISRLHKLPQVAFFYEIRFKK